MPTATIGQPRPLTPAQIEQASTLGAVNYACGSKPMPGWFNVDLFDAAFMGSVGGVVPNELKDVANLDLLAPHPFPDACFDYAFCEDFVEHLDQREAILFMTEVSRCLKPGGVFRIATPGLPGVMKGYAGLKYAEAFHAANKDFSAWGHKHFFCMQSLDLIATPLGFVSCEEVGYGDFAHPRLRNLETRFDQIGTNLYAELLKGGLLGPDDGEQSATTEP